MPIVDDEGFRAADAVETVPADAVAAGAVSGEGLALRLPNDARPEALAPHFARIALIAIPFPSFADGRGFSLAARLRALGYSGRLRAEGHLIADQYPFARAVGFDELLIGDDLAARQPEAVWRLAASRGRSLYQARRRAA
jgi:uncharacterized protein (DUF934 family)